MASVAAGYGDGPCPRCLWRGVSSSASEGGSPSAPWEPTVRFRGEGVRVVAAEVEWRSCCRRFLVARLAGSQRRGEALVFLSVGGQSRSRYRLRYRGGRDRIIAVQQGGGRNVGIQRGRRVEKAELREEELTVGGGPAWRRRPAVVVTFTPREVVGAAVGLPK
jgi:hypothetical protein